jgi:hypothetical protein
MVQKFKSVLNPLVCLAMLLLLGSKLSGQDIIIKKSGEEIKSKVIEIFDNDIKYRKIDNLEGPLYSISKSDVLIIIYENGKREVINAPSISIKNQEPPKMQLNPEITRGRIGRARAGALINFLSIAPVLAAEILTEFDEEALFATVIIGALEIPVSAIVAGNPMKKAGVRGSPVLRAFGWISFGLFATSTILALTEGDDYSWYSAPAFMVTSSTLLGIDNSLKAVQGKHRRYVTSIQPAVGYIRDYTLCKKIPTVGIRVNF